MKYTARYRCTECKIYLNRYRVMHSDGVCFNCGCSNGSTICSYETVVGYWEPIWDSWLDWFFLSILFCQKFVWVEKEQTDGD